MKTDVFSLAPLFPLTVCLIVGMVASTWVAVGWPFPLVLGGMVVVAWATGRWPVAQSAAIWICFVLLGMTIGNGHKEPLPDGIKTEAVVMSELGEKPKTLMADLLLTQTGELRRCYIWKDERSRQLQIGDPLTVCINDGHFVRWDGWQKGGNGLEQLSRLERVRLKALQFRHGLLERFRPTGDDADQYGVLAAMTLGDKSALTHEVRQTYSMTGASHVLALSGLHLGIIYLLLTRLMLGRRRLWLTQVVVVLAIWAFALMTGLSTSVVRSATMISIYALFSLGDRGHAPVNVLCFTAMLMLLVSPSSLYDVGFQLSFMSVLSILLFMPVMDSFVSKKWMLSHPVVHWLWSLTGVSLAAQIGTAPLVAYYFHYFSTYFLLTNLVVIPLATVILYGALASTVISALVPALLWTVGLMNTFLGWVAHLPFNNIGDLHPSVVQVAMLYVVIAVGYLLLITCTPASARYRSGWLRS